MEEAVARWMPEQVEAREVPGRIADQVDLRDHGCVFPWCPTRASRCDTDHLIQHAVGGDTCNLAPLCRRHHRVKTRDRRTSRPPET